MILVECNCARSVLIPMHLAYAHGTEMAVSFYFTHTGIANCCIPAGCISVTLLTRPSLSFCVGGSGGSRGGKGGASVPPFGLHLTLRSTDDKLNGTPFLAIELRKLLLWLTLECFRRIFVRKQIDWTGRAGSLSQKRSKWAWFYPKVGVASKISRARVYYNPPFGNSGSATGRGWHTRLLLLKLVAVNMTVAKTTKIWF